MKWIKASDRTPKKISKVIFRQISTKCILSESMARDWIEDEDLENLEWLDESDLPNEPSIDKILGLDNAWPLVDVLSKLIEATEILLDKKNYDGHGWEEISFAVKRGKNIINFLNTKPEPSIQDDGDVWDDFIVELEQLQRMEENDWEWNKKILKESYSLAKVNSKPQPLQDEGLEEAAEKHADSLYDKNTGSGQYRWLTAKEDFKAGAEYYKKLNK